MCDFAQLDIKGFMKEKHVAEWIHTKLRVTQLGSWLGQPTGYAATQRSLQGPTGVGVVPRHQPPVARHVDGRRRLRRKTEPRVLRMPARFHGDRHMLRTPCTPCGRAVRSMCSRCHVQP